MRRKRNLYRPGATTPFKLSRAKIENYLACPHCFYLDRRLGVGRPSTPPFLINTAVDTLLKKEFDGYRAQHTPHPLMTAAGIDAVPAQHPQLDTWRQNFQGVQTYDEASGFIVTGAIDDLWVTPDDVYIVADYKATAKRDPVSLNGKWQQAYKRQAEIYQWLLRKNGLEVSDTAWFVYCNGRLDLDRFDGRVEFHISMLPYEGSDAWIDGALSRIKETLDNDHPPPPNPECEYCTYREDARGDGPNPDPVQQSLL